MLERTLCWNGVEGLGKPKPHHFLRWMQGKPPMCECGRGAPVAVVAIMVRKGQVIFLQGFM